MGGGQDGGGGLCPCVSGAGGTWRWWRGTEVGDSKYSTCVLEADAQYFKDTV